MADTNTVRTLTVRQIQDASRYVAGAKEFVAANKDMASSSSIVGAVVSQTQAKISNAADPISRLVRAYDQSSASAIKFNNDLSVLNKQLEGGKVSADAAGRIYAGMVKSLGIAANGADLMAQGFIKLGTVVASANAEILEIHQSQMAIQEASQQLEIMTQRATALKAQLDPVGTSQARLNTELAEYNAMLKSNLISLDEFTKAELLARQRHDEFASSLNRTPAAMNDNNAAFRRQNLGYQAFDVGQGLAAGLPLPMILAQQGPQIAQMYAGAGGLKAALSDVVGIAGAAARALGPIGIAIGAVGAAAGVYFLTVHDGEEKAAADLKKHVDDIQALAQAWGDQLPAVKAYYDSLKKAQDLQEQQKAKNVTEGAFWEDAAKQFSTFAADFDRARSLIDTITPTGKVSPMAAAIRDFQELKKGVADHTATLQDAEKVSTDLSNVYAKMPLKVFNDAIASIKLLETELDTARQKSTELNNEFGKLGGLRPNQVIDLIHNRGNFPDVPADGPRPTKRPSDLDADETTKQESSYDQLIRTVQRRIDQQQLEIQIAGMSTEAKTRLRLEDELLAQAEEDLARSGDKDAKLAPQQIALIKQKADELARYQQIAAGQKFDQDQQDQIDALRLQADLIGKSAEEQARANAVYQADLAMRQQGLSLMDAEADRRRAVAVATAEASLEIQRQQAAYQSLQQAEGDAIDTMVTGSGSIKDVLNSAKQWLLQMAVANPLKNAFTGTNLPTITDLFSGKPSVPNAATSTAMMQVTATTVMINGSPVGGLPGVPGATGLAGLLGYNPAAKNATSPSSLIGAAANQNVVPAGAPPTDIEAYIRSAAIARGIDPNTAVAVARSEGGLTSWNQQSTYTMANGMREPSYGPYQLYMNGGLGNQFQQQTGLDPRLAQNGPAGVDYALDYAQKNGWSAFHGAANTGITNWQGINRNAPPVDTQQINNSLNKLSTTTTSASKDIGTLGDNSMDAGKSILDAFKAPAGQSGLPSNYFPPAPTQLPSNYFPPAPTSGFNPFSLFTSLFSLFGFADGTDYSPGGTFLVGERGRELVTLPRGSRVTPNHKMVATPSEPQKVSHFHEWNVTVSGNGDKELMSRMQTAANQSVAAAMSHYDANILPSRVQDIQQNPRMVG